MRNGISNTFLSKDKRIVSRIASRIGNGVIIKRAKSIGKITSRIAKRIANRIAGK